MRIKSACVFAVSLFVASTAMAKICKTVGPDGSVTYTDRPTASCDSADAPVAQPAAVSAPMTAAAALPTGPKNATRTQPPTDSADPVRDSAAVEKAVIGVMGLEDMVQRSYDFCANVLPTSIRRYGDATDGWRERNVGATAKMRRALSQAFNAGQQRLIADGVKLRNQQQLAPVRAAPKASQIKWCDQTANEVDSRALDAKENLTTPLSVY